MSETTTVPSTCSTPEQQQQALLLSSLYDKLELAKLFALQDENHFLAKIKDQIILTQEMIKPILQVSPMPPSSSLETHGPSTKVFDDQVTEQSSQPADGSTTNTPGAATTTQPNIPFLSCSTAPLPSGPSITLRSDPMTNDANGAPALSMKSETEVSLARAVQQKMEQSSESSSCSPNVSSSGDIGSSSIPVDNANDTATDEIKDDDANQIMHNFLLSLSRKRRSKKSPTSTMDTGVNKPHSPSQHGHTRNGKKVIKSENAADHGASTGSSSLGGSTGSKSPPTTSRRSSLKRNVASIYATKTTATEDVDDHAASGDGGDSENKQDDNHHHHLDSSDTTNQPQPVVESEPKRQKQKKGSSKSKSKKSPSAAKTNKTSTDVSSSSTSTVTAATTDTAIPFIRVGNKEYLTHKDLTEMAQAKYPLNEALVKNYKKETEEEAFIWVTIDDYDQLAAQHPRIKRNHFQGTSKAMRLFSTDFMTWLRNR